jgi:hypothetical protein
VTGSLDGQVGETSDAQAGNGRCYVREPIGTLTCEEPEQQ